MTNFFILIILLIVIGVPAFLVIIDPGFGYIIIIISILYGIYNTFENTFDYNVKDEKENNNNHEYNFKSERTQDKSEYKKNTNKDNIFKDEKYMGSILQLEGQVTPTKIKSQYKKLIKEYHPDKVSKLGSKLKKVAEEESKKINEAFEYFKDRYNIK